VLSVGNGIVAGSDPIDEWTETVAKLATMREALG
jgi:isochorismate synthase EntC